MQPLSTLLKAQLFRRDFVNRTHQGNPENLISKIEFRRSQG
jgi:hypothetical protein